MQRKSARCIIFAGENKEKVYLIHRINKGREYYVIPGGGIDTGETPLEAVKREILEECGMIMKNIKQLPDFSFDFDGRTEVFSLFTGEIEKKVDFTGDELKNLHEDNFYELLVFPVSKLDKINLLPKGIGDVVRDLR